MHTVLIILIMLINHSSIRTTSTVVQATNVLRSNNVCQCCVYIPYKVQRRKRAAVTPEEKGATKGNKQCGSFARILPIWYSRFR